MWNELSEAPPSAIKTKPMRRMATRMPSFSADTASAASSNSPCSAGTIKPGGVYLIILAFSHPLVSNPDDGLMSGLWDLLLEAESDIDAVLSSLRTIDSTIIRAHH